MRIRWGWAAAAITALVAALLVALTRSGSCASRVAGVIDDSCQSQPVGGYPTMVVLVVAGVVLSVVCARLAVRRR